MLSQFYDGRTVFPRIPEPQSVYFTTLPTGFDASLFPPSHDQSRSFRVLEEDSNLQLLSQPASVFFQPFVSANASELFAAAESFFVEQPANTAAVFNVLVQTFSPAISNPSEIIPELESFLAEQPDTTWLSNLQTLFTAAFTSSFRSADEELGPDAEQPNLDWLWNVLVPNIYVATQISSFIVDETSPGVLSLLDQPIDGWNFASQTPLFTVYNQSETVAEAEVITLQLLEQPQDGWLASTTTAFWPAVNQLESYRTADGAQLDASLLSQPDNAGSITPTGEVLRQRIRIPREYGGIHHWTR